MGSRLKQRRVELEEDLSPLDRDRPQNESVRIETGRLVLTPLSVEEPPDGRAPLQGQIAQHIPWVNLADLLIEVDGWTGFTQHFEHAGGHEPRNKNKDLLVHLHASSLAIPNMVVSRK
jgi:hypothetical protein